MNIKQFLAAAVMTATSASALAYSADFIKRDGTFWDEQREGWLFYEQFKPEQKEAQKQEEPVQQKKENEQVETMDMTPPPSPPPAPSTEQGPAPLSAEWFRENNDKYRDRMWDNPTPENVAAYWYLQNFQLERAETVSAVAEQVVINNPDLDSTTRRPMGAFASQQVERKASNAKKKALADLKEKVGVWFFFDSTSPYSKPQAKVAKFLERTHGFTVMPISVDGGEPSFDMFDNVRVDTGQAEKIGIRTLPAMYLVSPEGETQLVGQGVLSLSQLERRIMVVAQQKGWITEEQFADSRPLHNPKDMIVNPEVVTQQLENAKNPETGEIPPSELIKIISNGGK